MEQILKKKIVAVAAALAIILGGAACSSSGEPETALPADAVIIDVRSPEEFAEGHLEGAQLLDLNSGEFAAQVPSLDPEADYLLYCRSGNRSGQAASIMRDAGFSNVMDLGSVESASEKTGIPIVKD